MLQRLDTDPLRKVLVLSLVAFLAMCAIGLLMKPAYMERAKEVYSVCAPYTKCEELQLNATRHLRLAPHLYDIGRFGAGLAVIALIVLNLLRWQSDNNRPLRNIICISFIALCISLATLGISVIMARTYYSSVPKPETCRMDGSMDCSTKAVPNNKARLILEAPKIASIGSIGTGISLVMLSITLHVKKSTPKAA